MAKPRRRVLRIPGFFSYPGASDATAWGYVCAWHVVRRLPYRLCLWIARVAADQACDHGRGMDQLRRNLSRVVGPENVSRELIRQSMRSYARYWVEAFKLPSIAGDEKLIDVLDSCVVGKTHLEAAMSRGKGVILVLPHSGNWDMAGMYLAHRFQSFTTVAERLRPEALYEAFLEYRESLGFSVLPLSGGEPPFPRLKEVAEQGGIVCLLGERDLKRRGKPVDFFGEQTTFPVGAVELALKTEASLHVVHCWFEDDAHRPWGFSVSAPVDTSQGLEPALQQVADQVADNIAAHPADWHMLQPLWPADSVRSQAQKSGGY